MNRAHRARLVQAALRLVGSHYADGHDDDSWRDLASPPSALDCSTFVCRVAAEAEVYRPGLLVPDAAWLLDHLVEIGEPRVGDLVGYRGPGQARSPDVSAAVARHLMMYLGSGNVIGACPVAGKVVARPVDYEPIHGRIPWRLLDPPSFRTLSIIF